MSTLTFQAIGRGQLAAAKTFSILGLPKPSSKLVWCEIAKIIADACSELVREKLKHSARELKELVETDDEGYCTTAVSFDGSWCSCGWSARDGVVAGISLKTGKVLDVIHLSSSCSTCDRLEKLHSEGQLSLKEFLEKQVEHRDVCYLNHHGSTQLRFTKIVITLFHFTTTLNYKKYFLFSKRYHISLLPCQRRSLLNNIYKVEVGSEEEVVSNPKSATDFFCL